MSVPIGRYLVTEELGRGGMGIVWKGEDPVLGRPVAIKTLPHKTKPSQALIDRFYREARAVASLDSSPFVVKIYDMGIHDETIYYIVMEFVEGRTLGELIAERPVPDGKLMAERLQLFWQVLNAMAYAHEKGVVHRDLKPDNVMVTRTGRVKVMDFGLAFFAGSHSLTRADQVMGTIAYFAPEQARADADIDHRADIYSLGVILYELMTGQLPFDAQHPLDMMRKLLEEHPRNPQQLNPLLPSALAQIIEKALRKAPAERFQSVNHMKSQLEGALQQMSVEVSGLDPYATPSVPSFESKPAPPQPPAPPPEPPPNPFDQTLVETPAEKAKEERPSPLPNLPYLQALGNPTLASKDWIDNTAAEHVDPDWLAQTLGEARGEEPEKTERPSGPRVFCHSCGGDNPIDRHACVECGEVLKPNYYIVAREAQAYLDSGRHSLMMGNTREAIFELEQAIKRNPELGEAYLLLGKAHLVLMEFEKAQEALHEAVEWLEDSPEPLLVLADLYQQVDQREDVIACLLEALKLDPRANSVRCRLAFLYYESDMVEEALRHYRTVLRYDPHNVQANRQLGLILAAQDKLDESIYYLEQACRLDPNDSHSCSLLGRLYARTRQFRSAEDALLAAIERKGEDAGLRAELGSLYRTQNREDLAATELQKALSLDHGHLDARLQLSEIYERHGQADHALRELQEALKFHPHDLTVHRRLGEIYLQKNDLDRAMEHFEEVVRLDPSCAEMHNRLGRIYLKKKYDALSIAEYQKAVELHPVDPEYREDLGMAYYCAGKLDMAVRELHKAATLDGRNPDYFKAIGMLYYSMNEDEEAVRNLKWSLHLAPQDAQARGMLGQALTRQGLTNLAIQEFQRGLELDPGLHLLHLYLARACAAAGKHSQAIEAFRTFASRLESLRQSGFLGQAYVEMGQSYLADNDPSRAEEVFQAALARNPQDAQALLGLTRVSLRRGDLKKARTRILAALEQEPRNPAILNALADYHGEKGEWAEAAIALQRAIGEEPRDYTLHERLGRALRKGGRPDDAVAVFRRAAETFPRRRGRFMWLEGRIQARMGKWGDAALLFRRAIEHSPQDWRIYEDLGQACYRIGELDQAVATLEAAIDCAPPQEQEALQSLLESFRERARS